MRLNKNKNYTFLKVILACIVAILFLAPTKYPGAQEKSTKFKIGQRVETTDSLNVRDFQEISEFTLIGAQPSGTKGTIVDGPIYREGYWWWKIDYEQDEDGWSVENYLVKDSEPMPLPDQPLPISNTPPPATDPVDNDIEPEASSPSQETSGDEKQNSFNRPYFWISIASLFGIACVIFVLVLKRRRSTTDDSGNNFIIWR